MKKSRFLGPVFLMTILLALQCVFPVQAEEQALSFGRITVAMPEITAEIKGSNYAKENISAKLETESLTIEEVVAYGKDTSVRAYLLVDLSKSVDHSFELIKENIIKYVDGMGKDDKVDILTFGEDKVVSILDGTETKEEIKDKVRALECDENKTLFYEALARAYRTSNATISEFDREYVIAFSDGIDDQQGNTTYAEIKELYATHALPVYAACTPKASKSAADKFGELARLSGGKLSVINDGDDFNHLFGEINDVTLITMKANSNIADGKTRQLAVKVEELQAECDVPVARFLEDNTAPAVTSVQYKVESNLIIVDFSEKVSGASSISAYAITSKNKQPIGIESVEIVSSEKRAEIKLQDKIANGVYTISFQGITDQSYEKNLLEGTSEITVDGVKGEVPIWLILVIVFGLIVLSLLIVMLIILAKKKNNSNLDKSQIAQQVGGQRLTEYETSAVIREKHHIKAENLARIRLKIQTGRTSEQNIETNIVSSLIVGRSSTCDIYIDDTKLSRQHFVIEYDGEAFYIMDLQSSNGTKLNGIGIHSRQVLHSGDKIAAGLSDIYITTIE